MISPSKSPQRGDFSDSDNTIVINDIVLTSESIETIKTWQENNRIEELNDILDDISSMIVQNWFNISGDNPEIDSDIKHKILQISYLRGDIKTFRTERREVL